MPSLKAWYWAGLGVLALSFGTSSMGRCWMDWASGKVDEARLRAQPYVAMAEMALGHTQSGYARAQASVARLEARRAQLQAVQARWEAQRARIDAANQVMINMQHEIPSPEQFVNQSLFDSRDFVAPNVRVTSRSVVVNGRRHRVMVCPGTATDLVVPDVSTPKVTTVEDPI